MEVAGDTPTFPDDIVVVGALNVRMAPKAVKSAQVPMDTLPLTKLFSMSIKDPSLAVPVVEARARPTKTDRAARVMVDPANIFPMNTLDVPTAQLEPRDQKTLLACPPLASTITDLEPVVNVEVLWNSHTAYSLFWASSVSVLDAVVERVEKQYMPAVNVIPEISAAANAVVHVVPAKKALVEDKSDAH